MEEHQSLISLSFLPLILSVIHSKAAPEKKPWGKAYYWEFLHEETERVDNSFDSSSTGVPRAPHMLDKNIYRQVPVMPC